MRPPMVNFRRMSVTTPWPLVWAVTLAYIAARCGWLLLRVGVVAVRNWRSWPAVVIALVAVDAYQTHGWWPHLVASVGIAGVAGWWWRRWPESYQRFVVLPVLSRWRRLWVYRRQWHETMTLCGLVRKYDQGEKPPRLLSVSCSYATDEVVLRMPRGQNPEAYHKASRDLAYSFGSRHCRVFSTRHRVAPARTGRAAWLLRTVDRVRYRDRPRLVRLVFIRRDPLTRVVAPLPVPATPDFKALPLGLREDLAVYALRLLATHLLIVGATRSGKGSVIWSLIRAMAAGVKSGLVRLWVLDPKGGMELFMGRPMFSRYEDSDHRAMADMLDDAVGIMRQRQAKLRGKVRVHTPTVDDPLVVIVVDELASLLAYLPDSDLRGRITQSLGLLLSQGAGLGVLVVGASQDPRKEVLTLRDQFPTRIALRLNESNHVDLVLSDGARNRGALADQIPETMQGTGYVVIEGHAEPVRVRFSYITDDLIRDMAATFPAPADQVTAPAPAPSVPQQPTPTTGTRTSNGNGRHVYRPTTAKQDAPLLPPSLLNALNLDPTANGGDPR